MDWIDYLVLFLLCVFLGSGFSYNIKKCEKNQERIIKQNEQIIELLKTKRL